MADFDKDAWTRALGHGSLDTRISCLKDFLRGDNHALGQCFYWQDTPQGYHYWEARYDDHSLITEEDKALIGKVLELARTLVVEPTPAKPSPTQDVTFVIDLNDGPKANQYTAAYPAFDLDGPTGSGATALEAVQDLLNSHIDDLEDE